MEDNKLVQHEELSTRILISQHDVNPRLPAQSAAANNADQLPIDPHAAERREFLSLTTVVGVCHHFAARRSLAS